MRTIKIFTYTAAVALTMSLAACKKDFLNRAPEVKLSEDQVFADPLLASQFADNAYNFLIDDYARLNDHRGITGQFSDEAVSANNDVSVRTINQGKYHDHYEAGGASLNDIKDVYVKMYAGIRITNTVLGRMNDPAWPADGVLRNRVEGEMHFLRAFMYFELIKRFGGVVILDKRPTPNEDIDIPRKTYDECLSFILADLDAADGLLPLDAAAGDFGRATKGAAYALRSRALLFAASPLNNATNSSAKWAAAAAAAKRLMVDLNTQRANSGLSKYLIDSTDTRYDQVLNLSQSNEYIMIKPRGARGANDGLIIDFAMSPGSGGEQGTCNPTQNHVDLYEVITRDPISKKIISSAPIATASNYNAQQPYASRDPRFYANIIYNDMPWQGRRIDMYSQKTGLGYDFIESNTKYTATCYYSRKMWPEAYRRSTAGSTFINFIFFRYAEVLLNYAEAQNEAVGADQSVYDAINQIRDRVGMPPLPIGLSKDDMRVRIHNERAVELAFEDFRWYDILRWRAKELVTQPMYGIRVVKNSSNVFVYTRTLLTASYQKVHEDYMDRYPIPRSEIYKSKALVQNPGW